MRGHIAKKGKKYYIVLDLGKDEATGKRRQKWVSGYDLKREAEKALPSVLLKYQDGISEEEGVKPEVIMKKPIEGQKEHETIEQMMLKWLQDKFHSVEYNTWLSYKSTTLNNIIPHIGQIRINELTTEDLQKLYNETLYPSPLSAGSIRKLDTILSNALARMVTWGKLKHNVADTVELPKGKKHKFQVWNEQQIQQFLAEAEGDQFYVIFELALSTGLRQSEILGAPRAEFNLENQTLGVRQAYTLSREGGHALSDTKNDSSIRSVALFPHSARLIASHIALQQRERARLEPLGLYHDSGLIFQTGTGRPVSARNVMRNYYKIIARIQQDDPEFPKIRFQDFRHSHATRLLQKGAHPKIVQERLGHSSITMTMDTYSHVLPNMQAAVLKGIGDAIVDPPKPL